MPRDLPDVFEPKKEALADGDPWIWLYEVEIPSSPATRLRVTDHRTVVNFGTDSSGNDVDYLPISVRHGGFRISDNGDLPSFDITVPNQPLVLDGEQYVPKPVELLEAYDGLIGQPVVVRLVSACNLDDETAQIRIDAQVSNVSVNDKSVAFSLSLPGVQRLKFPSRRLTGKRCTAIFGSGDCGYAIPASPTDTVGGGFSFCTRTVDACDERGDDEEARGLERLHPKRFNGFPALVGLI